MFINGNLFILSEWNVGMLGIKAEVKHYNCKKTPSNPLFHYSIIPLFQLGLPARALQWQAGRSP
jgi:hypothetical protein